MNSRCWSVLKYNTTYARTSIPNFSGHIRVHDDGSMKTESSVVVLWYIIYVRRETLQQSLL